MKFCTVGLRGEVGLNGGNIINVGEMQYRITNDKFNLIYQWDDLFGIVIVYRDSDKVVTDLENVFAF